jgi:hypothetical protein
MHSDLTPERASLTFDNVARYTSLSAVDDNVAGHGSPKPSTFLSKKCNHTWFQSEVERNQVAAKPED